MSEEKIHKKDLTPLRFFEEAPLESVTLILRWTCPKCGRTSYLPSVTENDLTVTLLSCECGENRRIPCLEESELNVGAVAAKTPLRTFADALLMLPEKDLKEAASALLGGEWPAILPKPPGIPVPYPEDFLRCLGLIVSEHVSGEIPDTALNVRRRGRRFVS